MALKIATVEFPGKARENRRQKAASEVRGEVEKLGGFFDWEKNESDIARRACELAEEEISRLEAEAERLKRALAEAEERCQFAQARAEAWKAAAGAWEDAATIFERHPRITTLLRIAENTKKQAERTERVQAVEGEKPADAESRASTRDDAQGK